MAINITEANSVSHRFFDKPMTQQIYEDSAVLTKLKQNNSIVCDGGTSIQFPIRYVKLGRANAVGPHQEMTFEQKVTRTAGNVEWKYYNCDNMISWDERTKNSGKEKIVNLLADKADEIRQDMMDRFATDLYTTNPNGLGFTSLPAIVDRASNYATVEYATVTEWQAAIEDTTTTELVLYGSNSLSASCNAATFGKHTPDLHMTTRNLASKFESLIEPQKRYKDKKMADAGFTNTTFHGVPVVGDDFCIAKMWLGLDMKQFELRYHKDWNFDVTDWKELFPSFPRAMGKLMSWAGNMVCKMRKSSFKYTVLDYTI